jgi:hypothetical protein
MSLPQRASPASARADGKTHVPLAPSCGRAQSLAFPSTNRRCFFEGNPFSMVAPDLMQISRNVPTQRPSLSSIPPHPQLRKVPDELQAFRKRAYDLGGGFPLAEASQVETTSALRKWFHNVQRRQKEQTWEMIGSVGEMPSVVLTPEQMLEKRMYETNMSRGEVSGAATMRSSGRGSPGGRQRKLSAALGSMVAGQIRSSGPESAMPGEVAGARGDASLGARGEVAGARGGSSLYESVSPHAQKSFVTSEASGRVSREGSVVYIEESKDVLDDAGVPPAKQDGYLRTWALGLSSRPERPKTAPAGGRRTRTLFGVPVAQEDGSGLISPDFRPAPSSGAMSSMSTARATPRNQGERVSPWMRGSDDGNGYGNSSGRNDTKGSQAAVSFLLGSTPATPGKRPSTAPARRQQANNSAGKGLLSGGSKRPSSARGPRGVIVSPSPGEGWAITQASSPIPPSSPRHSRQVAFSPRPPTLVASPSMALSPTSPRGESHLAAVVSPRGGRSIGGEVPRVTNPENRELEGGFGYIAPHSGWASAHAVSPRSRETAKGRTLAKPASPYSPKQGRPTSARTLSGSSRPDAGQSRVRPSSAKSPGGTRAR